MKIPYGETQFIEAVKETIKANNIESCYIRPICFFGYGKIGLNPAGSPVNCSIAVWPWGSYLGDKPVRVKTSKFIRLHHKSTYADAKICGHYVNSILASVDAKDQGYDEALLLDYKGDIAEGPGENIFLVKNNKLITPSLNSSALDGITRRTIITLANDMKLKIKIRKLVKKN